MSAENMHSKNTNKQGRKRPLNTPKRERERKREREKERERGEGDREVKGIER